MSEFKFGDLVFLNGELGVFTHDNNKRAAVFVVDGGCRTHYSALYEELTLVSRHQEWIKLDEADGATLPAAGDAYCTYCPSGATEEFNGVGVLFLDADSDGDEGDLLWISDGGATLELSDVTHWMPLPEPPKELL